MSKEWKKEHRQIIEHSKQAVKSTYEMLMFNHEINKIKVDEMTLRMGLEYIQKRLEAKEYDVATHALEQLIETLKRLTEGNANA